jgi:hypothetical protein
MNRLIEKRMTVGDTRTPISDTLIDDGGNPINLAGHTVKFRLIDADANAVVDSAAATIDDEGAGDVSYPWQDADVDTAGTFYYWWIAIRTSDGNEERFPSGGRMRRLVIDPAE